MGNLGRRNELLHVRFSYMADRLEDLKSLTEDFNLLTRPIEEMAAELPRAKARVLEVEALLSREMQENKTLKRELSDILEKYSTCLDDRASAINQNRSLKEELERNETALADDGIRLAELEKLLDNAERQVAIEVENRGRLEGETASLAAELGESKDVVHALEMEASRHLGRTSGMERELQRLQKVVDGQVLQVVDLQSRCQDLERQVQQREQESAGLRTRLDFEEAEHRKSAHDKDVVVSGLSAEKSSLILKVEALEARLQAAEQTAAQAREQLAEKDAGLRNAAEAIRSNAKENAALERRVAALDLSLSDRRDQLKESQRVAEEASRRNDMLTKALSAKSAGLDSAMEKAQSRSERIEELTKRYEHDRALLDATNRRLVEELENEKAERTLAQGALKIARESRASLQRQNEALKRSNRAMRNATSAEGEAADLPASERAPVGNADASNVSLFTVPTREGDEVR